MATTPVRCQPIVCAKPQSSATASRPPATSPHSGSRPIIARNCATVTRCRKPFPGSRRSRRISDCGTTKTPPRSAPQLFLRRAPADHLHRGAAPLAQACARRCRPGAARITGRGTHAKSRGERASPPPAKWCPLTRLCLDAQREAAVGAVTRAADPCVHSDQRLGPSGRYPDRRRRLHRLERFLRGLRRYLRPGRRLDRGLFWLLTTPAPCLRSASDPSTAGASSSRPQHPRWPHPPAQRS